MKKINRRDVILILVLLVIAGGAALVIQFGIKRNGATAIITVDGTVVHRMSLLVEEEYTVEGIDGGHNVVVVQQGEVYMKEADCPDEICVKTGHIHKTGETIVCLPHRVVVEVTGAEQELDSIVR